MLNSLGMRKAFGYLFLKNALLVCFAFLDLLLVLEPCLLVAFGFSKIL